MLQQLQNAHGHAATLQTDAMTPALSLLLVLRLARWLLADVPAGTGSAGGEGSFEVGQVRVVRGRFGERESTESQFDDRNAQRPYIRFDGVLSALYAFGL